MFRGAAASNPSKTARTKRGGLSSDRGEEATEKTAENDWTILDPSKLNLTMISKINHHQLCGFFHFVDALSLILRFRAFSPNVWCN